MGGGAQRPLPSIGSSSCPWHWHPPTRFSPSSSSPLVCWDPLHLHSAALWPAVHDMGWVAVSLCPPPPPTGLGLSLLLCGGRQNAAPCPPPPIPNPLGWVSAGGEMGGDAQVAPSAPQCLGDAQPPPSPVTTICIEKRTETEGSHSPLRFFSFFSPCAGVGGGALCPIPALGDSRAAWGPSAPHSAVLGAQLCSPPPA